MPKRNTPERKEILSERRKKYNEASVMMAELHTKMGRAAFKGKYIPAGQWKNIRPENR